MEAAETHADTAPAGAVRDDRTRDHRTVPSQFRRAWQPTGK